MPLIDAAWKRIELVPMDPHCGDISLALYRRDDPGGPVACVHTYSAKPEAAARVNAVTRAVGALGGLDRVERENTYLAYGCGTWHQAASKRLFLEACKLDSDTPGGVSRTWSISSCSPSSRWSSAPCGRWGGRRSRSGT